MSERIFSYYCDLFSPLLQLQVDYLHLRLSILQIGESGEIEVFASH